MDQVFALQEYQTLELSSDSFSDSAAHFLLSQHTQAISVEGPGRICPNWKLKADGTVGWIPCPDGNSIRIDPKISVLKMFSLLERVYSLKTFRFLDGSMVCAGVDEMYEFLAQALAVRIHHRLRQGLYRTYITEAEELPFIRGRLQVNRMIRSTDRLRLPCHYEENTADVIDNQILAWTLHMIARSGFCQREEVRGLVREVYQGLLSQVSLSRCLASDCLNREYHRLNSDYRMLHNLCRFFLENMGPTLQEGSQTMLPFLVPMPQLFEKFVASWVIDHLPSGWHLNEQVSIDVSVNPSITFRPDLIVRNHNGDVQWVLDTKYRSGEHPSASEVEQVVAYAHALRHADGSFPAAGLIYAGRVSRPIDRKLQGIHIRTLAFPLDEDLDQAGERLLAKLGLKDRFLT